MDWSLVASAVLGAAGLVIGTVLLVAWRRRASERRYAMRALPPLVIRARGPSLPVPTPRATFARGRGGWSDRPVSRTVLADDDPGTPVEPPPAGFRESWSANGREDGRAATADGGHPPIQSRPAPAFDLAGEAEPGTLGEPTVRMQRPMEETLQFLPGRLEVTEGEDRGQSIRFVRLWGDPPAITFGRSAGPVHRHVQLRSLTVSRLQARMRYEARRWEVSNLSETNPTLVNGEELSLHGSRILEHGDRIEMGEVVFRFWEY